MPDGPNYGWGPASPDPNGDCAYVSRAAAL